MSRILVALTVAFFVMVERKFLGGVQLRVGPYVVGIMRLLQTVTDGVKLLTKSMGSAFMLLGRCVYLVCIVILAVSANVIVGFSLIVVRAYWFVYTVLQSGGKYGMLGRSRGIYIMVSLEMI